MNGMAHVEETDREFANRIAHELEATREELSSSIDPTTSILGDSLVDMEEGRERLQRRQRFIDHERVDTFGPVMHNLSSHSANQTFSSSTSSLSDDPTSNDQESARNFQMQYTILSLLHQSQNTTLGVWINCIMNIPQVIAIIYYLYIYYRDAEFARVHANVYSQCEKPLYFWAGDTEFDYASRPLRPSCCVTSPMIE